MWETRLGLRWWTLHVAYDRTGAGHRRAEGEGPDRVAVAATCKADWRYLEATITFNMPELLDIPTERVEQIIIHELCHALVNEMRDDAGTDNMDHEERVVTAMTSAFLWTRDAAAAKGKRAGKAEKPKEVRRERI